MLQQIRDAFHPTEIIAEICPAYRHASLWPEARAAAEIASAIRLASCWVGNAMISPLEMMLPTGLVLEKAKVDRAGVERNIQSDRAIGLCCRLQHARSLWCRDGG